MGSHGGPWTSQKVAHFHLFTACRCPGKNPRGGGGQGQEPLGGKPACGGGGRLGLSMLFGAGRASHKCALWIHWKRGGWQWRGKKEAWQPRRGSGERCETLLCDGAAVTAQAGADVPPGTSGAAGSTSRARVSSLLSGLRPAASCLEMRRFCSASHTLTPSSWGFSSRNSVCLEKKKCFFFGLSSRSLNGF